MGASHERKRRRSTSTWLKVTVIAWIASLYSPAYAQVPQLDAKYRGSVVAADRTIPLLDGEWTVVAVESARGTNQGGSNTPAVARAYLAQMSGNRLSRWIHVSTNVEVSGGGMTVGGWIRNKSICDRSDTHASFSDSNHNNKDADCWVLNHIGMTLGKQPSQAVIDFYRWSDTRGRPNTALALEYFL